MSNSEKRVPLNTKVNPEIRKAIGEIADRERRTESNVVEILLEWAIASVREAGSTLELLNKKPFRRVAGDGSPGESQRGVVKRRTA